MKKILSVLFLALFSASMSLTGCASDTSTTGRSVASTTDTNAEYGVVKSINETTETQSGVNVGTLIGGAIGAVAGHQFGGGRGQTAATVAGAVGGAVIGTKVGNRGGDQMYKIAVKLKDGQVVNVNQKGDVADLRVGQRVKIVDDQVYPV
ncbi:MAG TPA: glycine zipper 2TM domain-containing protein [Gammaproteobacteria bacterium]